LLKSETKAIFTAPPPKPKEAEKPAEEAPANDAKPEGTEGKDDVEMKDESNQEKQ